MIEHQSAKRFREGTNYSESLWLDIVQEVVCGALFFPPSLFLNVIGTLVFHISRWTRNSYGRNCWKGSSVGFRRCPYFECVRTLILFRVCVCVCVCVFSMGRTSWPVTLTLTFVDILSLNWFISKKPKQISYGLADPWCNLRLPLLCRVELRCSSLLRSW